MITDLVIFVPLPLGKGYKKTVVSVIMIIPCRSPSPSFFKTVIALGYFWGAVFYKVIRYVLTLILVMFQTNFGCVLGEIYPKNVIDRSNQFQEIG